MKERVCVVVVPPLWRKVFHFPCPLPLRLESLLGKMKEIVDWVVLLDRPSSIDNCSIPIISTDILINFHYISATAKSKLVEILVHPYLLLFSIHYKIPAEIAQSTICTTLLQL